MENIDNIFKYIKWRGDLTLEQSEFNEIDSLILCRLSYLPLDDQRIPKHLNNAITIFDASYRFFHSGKVEHYVKDGEIVLENDLKLLKTLGKAKRFKDMKIFAYVNRIDTEEEKQFSALSIQVNSDLTYVAFKGTDNTLVGWKEDFNMGFVSPIPSQAESVIYLNKVGEETKEINSDLWVGGHSKGGNLAVYSSSFCEKEYQDRIIHIHNFDGPGFSCSIVEDERYQSIINKVNTYIPQTSIVGMILNHEESYIIVQSNHKGFFQHDIYSWSVKTTKLVHLQNITARSKYLNKTLKKWINNMDKEERSLFFDTLYSAVTATGATKITDFNDKRLSKTRLFINSIRGLDKDTRKTLSEYITLLIKSLAQNITSVTSKDLINIKTERSADINKDQLEILKKHEQEI